MSNASNVIVILGAASLLFGGCAMESTDLGTGSEAVEAGHAILLWRHAQDTRVYAWVVDENGTRTSSRLVHSNVPASWDLAPGSADFDGDGIDDAVWRNEDDGKVIVWLLNANGSKKNRTLSVPAASSVGAGWVLVGAGHDRADGSLPELYWKNTTTGAVRAWSMSHIEGNAVIKGSAFNGPSDLSIRGVGDVDGDGRADLLSGFKLYVRQPGGYDKVLSKEYLSPIRATPAADVDGDGDDDVFDTVVTGRRPSRALTSRLRYMENLTLAEPSVFYQPDGDGSGWWIASAANAN